mgnify:CR=1 FL=1
MPSITPTGGTVVFDGRDTTRASPSEKVVAGLGYGPQGGESFRSLSVTDNLVLGGYALADEYPVRKFSGYIDMLNMGEGAPAVQRTLIAEDALGYKDANRHPTPPRRGALFS